MMQETILNDGLVTLLVEVKSILNSRPLTPVTLDPKADVPLTPNHLLLLRESPNLRISLLEHFQMKTIIPPNVDVKFNIYHSSFGFDGVKNIYQLNKFDRKWQKVKTI